MERRESGLPDGRQLAEEVDILARHGRMSEILKLETESSLRYKATFDACQGQVLVLCFQQRPVLPVDIKKEAGDFLDKFFYLKENLLADYVGVTSEIAMQIATCLIDTTPASLRARAVELREEEEQRGDVEMINNWSLVVSITAEANRIWKERMAPNSASD